MLGRVKLGFGPGSQAQMQHEMMVSVLEAFMCAPWSPRTNVKAQPAMTRLSYINVILTSSVTAVQFPPNSPCHHMI